MHNYVETFQYNSTYNVIYQVFTYMTFHLAQVKYVNFLDRLIWDTAAVYTHVSPQLSWLILGTMSPLGQVVFIWFLLKNRNEKKKNL